LFFVILLIFVDYKKGSKCWVAIAPYLYLGGIWYMFLICPIVNLVMQVVVTSMHPTLSDGFWLEPWAITFSALQLT